MIRGERVGLREVRRSDMDNFLVWLNDPEVMQYMGGYRPQTEMTEEKWMEGLPDRVNTDVQFVIVALDGDTEKPIGSLGLNRINGKDRNALFGILIGEKDCWSSGYGTEAARLTVDYGFEQLNLHRIDSMVFDFNERSYRMHLRAGFTEEGRMRKCEYINGQYRDVVMFGLLRSEWEKRIKRKEEIHD